MFRPITTVDDIIIDPINRTQINVASINGVDLCKHISGIQSGYGINVVNNGGGLYEINFAKDLIVEQKDLEAKQI